MPKGKKGFQKGNKLGEKFKKGMVAWSRGLRLSDEIRATMKKNHADFRREKHPNWRGGRTSVYDLIRQLLESKNWKTECLKRDKYTYQECGQHGGALHIHHKITFSKLLSEFLDEYDQFSPIEDKETLVRLAVKWKPFWDVTNGQTLCFDCHEKTDTYLCKKNKRKTL